MTQLEILELAREGIMHRMGAAIQEEARAAGKEFERRKQHAPIQSR